MVAGGIVVFLRVRGDRQQGVVDVRRRGIPPYGRPVLVLHDDDEHRGQRRGGRRPGRERRGGRGPRGRGGLLSRTRGGRGGGWRRGGGRGGRGRSGLLSGAGGGGGGGGRGGGGRGGGGGAGGRGGGARGAGGGRRGGRGRRGALGADEDAPILPVRLGDVGVCERGLRGEVETGRTHRPDHELARGAREARAGAPLTRVLVEHEPPHTALPSGTVRRDRSVVEGRPGESHMAPGHTPHQAREVLPHAVRAAQSAARARNVAASRGPTVHRIDARSRGRVAVDDLVQRVHRPGRRRAGHERASQRARVDERRGGTDAGSIELAERLIERRLRSRSDTAPLVEARRRRAEPRLEDAEGVVDLLPLAA